MTPQSFLLLFPLTVANYLLKADKEGVLHSKLTSSFTCNKLAPFGNLSVITSTNSDHVRLIDPCLPKKTIILLRIYNFLQYRRI